ncbi:MAG: ketol-acid reductoisomerase [Thermoplasmata archaeon]|jgi:ketol-acid reductoisomerase|nr:ketol-acid reductoisomerase [Thermoplasmata archaeon]
MYYNKDADLKVLKGKQVAVIGYGIQGRAQSLNLRDSGVKVVLGLNLKDETWKRAKADRMKIMPIPEAVKSSDIVMMLIPDEVQKKVYDADVAPYLREGMVLDFAHGFNIHFKRIVPPNTVDVIMVAPKGPGALVRETYLAGIGVPALIAVHQDHSGKAKKYALAIAKGLKATTRGVIETTFKEETETDLFGEQVDLCGGASQLVKASFDVLVDEGYQPEIAYFEVLHELKLIIDLVQKGGIEGMWDGVSNTAEYGGRTRGPVIIDSGVKAAMVRTLRDIQSGKFAKEWVDEYEAGMPTLTKLRKDAEKSNIEVVGKKIRKMFD